jgi:hypothetical protein
MQAEVTHGIRIRGFGFWGGEMMKIVTIPIKVEIPDDTRSVTVNESGEVFSHKTNPERLELISEGLWVSEGCEKVAIVNWRETLTEVK